MASLICKNGRWSLQFRVRPNEERQTIALGTTAEATALGFQRRVESLVNAIRADDPPDPSTAKWVAGLSDAHHAKLARAGLVTPRGNTSRGIDTVLLGAFLDGFISNREKLVAAGKNRPQTVDNMKQVRRCLVDCFGTARPLDRITPGDCDAWRDWLAAEQHLAENTIRRRCGIARQFFRAAVRQRLLTENPFADMAGCSSIGNRERDYFVTRAEAERVLDACPDAQWRLLFALSRYGGLRCPSEHLGLRWGGVDWERNRFTVYSPKTAHKGKPSRVVPLFPELRPYLEEVWDEAEPETVHVITRYRESNVNLRTQLLRILEKAGVKAWPKLFQNLRATRATELVASGWPEYKVCKWLGHTAAVAEKHYWQVTDDYDRAANGSPTALQMALQTPSATPCEAVKDDFPPNAARSVTARNCRKLPPPAAYSPNVQARPAGFEPATNGLEIRCSIP